ncbi:hypothetical protein Bca101_035661 [Brassica carinata]
MRNGRDQLKRSRSIEEIERVAAEEDEIERVAAEEDLVSLGDSFSIKSPKTAEARTSPITELVPHRSALTLSAIVSSKPIDSPQYSSEEDGSDEEAAVETSETEIEEEIESTRVSPTKKRKNRFRDTGAESRKKRLLCQRSTEKYRDLEEEMKSYIQSMCNSSFTALGLEMSEKFKENVNLEIARVAQDMKQKLKITTVAMVVVGAIVGIWTSRLSEQVSVIGCLSFEFDGFKIA